MIWGKVHKEFLEFVEQENYMKCDEQVNNQDTGFLFKIIVPKEKKDSILKCLKVLGIHRKSIFLLLMKLDVI